MKLAKDLELDDGKVECCQFFRTKWLLSLNYQREVAFSKAENAPSLGVETRGIFLPF